MPLVCWKRSDGCPQPVLEQGQHLVERGVQVGPVPTHRIHCRRQVLLPVGKVAPVDREGREELDQGCLDVGPPALLRLDVELASQLAGDAPYLRVEDGLRDVPLVVPNELAARAARRPRSRSSSSPSVASPAGSTSTRSISAERVVPGRAGRLPALGQHLSRLEDLLDHHPGRTGEAGQVVEVRRRMAQTVRVVDPQPVDEPLAEPATDLRVRGLEDVAVLDPHAGKRVDREEAAVVEVVVGCPPAHQPVVLAVVDDLRVVGAVVAAGRQRGSGGRGSRACRRRGAGS